MTRYSMIALDIDGTIRSREYPLSDRTREAIDGARAAGAVVTVATGRMFQSARSACAELDLTSPIASFQGAVVGDPSTGEVLWHRPLTESMAMAALGALSGSGHEVLAYVGDDVYVNEMTTRAESYADRNGVNVHLVDDLQETASHQPTRLVAFGSEEEMLGLEADLKAHFDSRLYVTRSLPTFCEVLHPESGKEKAISWLCDRIGSRREETVAFGNGYNDVPMLVWAGLGVAIGGAAQDAIDVADRVALPIEADGVAQVIEGLLRDGLIAPPSGPR